MSYERELLIEAVLGVLGKHEPQEATELQAPFDESLWGSLHEHGFTLVGIADEAGGAGGELADAVAVARCSGRMASAVPLADSVLVGGWLGANAGLRLDDQGPVGAPLHRQRSLASRPPAVGTCTARSASSPGNGRHELRRDRGLRQRRVRCLLPRRGRSGDRGIEPRGRAGRRGTCRRRAPR